MNLKISKGSLVVNANAKTKLTKLCKWFQLPLLPVAVKMSERCAAMGCCFSFLVVAIFIYFLVFFGFALAKIWRVEQ